VELSLFLLGDPVSKLRPRVTSKGTYTPKRTKDYADYVRVKANEYMKVNSFPPFVQGVPLVLALGFTVRSKETARPDLVNLICNIQDALNGVFYYDDSQIVGIIAAKAQHNEPGVLITVKEYVNGSE